MKNRIVRMVSAMAVMMLLFGGCAKPDDSTATTTTEGAPTTTTTVSDGPTGTPTDTTTSATGGATVTTTTTKPVEGPVGGETVNKTIRLPASPEKETALPSTISDMGAPAPQWIRNSEMYNNSLQQIALMSGAEFEKWTEDFVYMNGTWGEEPAKYAAAGLYPGCYHDYYHVFDYVDHSTEYAVYTSDGVPALSDYSDPDRGKLYPICHNCPDTILPYIYKLLDQTFEFGINAIFIDDVRLPADAIADSYQTCYSTLHTHTVSGTTTDGYFNSTIPAMYQYTKQKSVNNFVGINGGIVYGIDQTARRDSVENCWALADGFMWENAIYDGNMYKWTKWPELKQAGEYIKKGVANGKVHLLLYGHYAGMQPAAALDAAIYTLAYARMYDALWSDYYSLYLSQMDKDLVKEIYSTKTGPAGNFGEFYGVVKEEETGKVIAGATVSCGQTTVKTDANGQFRIRIPAASAKVTVEKDGYTKTEGTLTGYNCTLTMKRTSGKVYYVSVLGSNSNSGTSPKTPWRSLNYADANELLKPGDTVVVQAGTYNVPNQTKYSCSGTAAAPITYVAEGDVRIRVEQGEGTGIVLNGSHVVMDGFHFEGTESGPAGLLAVNGTGVEIRNCRFSDSAFFNANSKTKSAAAVVLAGKDAFFHHNVVGPDLYGDAAVAVRASGVKVVNNTFDGSRYDSTAKTAAAIVFNGKAGGQVINNIFANFQKAFGSAPQVTTTFDGNLFYKAPRGQDSCKGAKDITDKDPGFMWQPYQDYDLNSTGAALNAGVDAGFSYYGSGPDIGAYERRCTDASAEVDSTKWVYRIFADSVVIINKTKLEDVEVTIPVGVANATLTSVGYHDTYKTNAQGDLTLTVPADGALILKLKS